MLQIENQQCDYLGVCDRGHICQARFLISVFDNEMEDYVLISEHPQVPIKWFDGKNPFEYCDYVNENISSANFYDKDFLNKLADGYYEIIMESGCWASYDHYHGAYEGDGDAVFKVVREIKEEEFDKMMSE